MVSGGPAMPDHYQRIKQRYDHPQGESIALFKEVLSASA